MLCGDEIVLMINFCVSIFLSFSFIDTTEVAFLYTITKTKILCFYNVYIRLDGL